jgi:hypothetical protein
MVSPRKLGRQHYNAQDDRYKAGTWQDEHREPGEHKDNPNNQDSYLSQRSRHVSPVLGEPSHARTGPPIAIATRRLIRSSTGGWVENSETTPPAESGLTKAIQKAVLTLFTAATSTPQSCRGLATG